MTKEQADKIEWLKEAYRSTPNDQDLVFMIAVEYRLAGDEASAKEWAAKLAGYRVDPMTVDIEKIRSRL